MCRANCQEAAPAAGGTGSRAVLEVRSHEVPFILYGADLKSIARRRASSCRSISAEIQRKSASFAAVRQLWNLPKKMASRTDSRFLPQAETDVAESSGLAVC